MRIGPRLTHLAVATTIGDWIELATRHGLPTDKGWRGRCSALAHDIEWTKTLGMIRQFCQEAFFNTLDRQRQKR